MSLTKYIIDRRVFLLDFTPIIEVVIAAFVAIAGYYVYLVNKVKKETRSEVLLNGLVTDVRDVRDTVKKYDTAITEVKSEVKELCARAEAANRTANKAHERIDIHINNHTKEGEIKKC